MLAMSGSGQLKGNAERAYRCMVTKQEVTARRKHIPTNILLANLFEPFYK